MAGPELFHVTDDVRIDDLRPLIPPAILMEELPMTDRATQVVVRARSAAGRIMAGEDPRLLVVVGPCSIHDPVAAREYAGRLAEAARRFEQELFLIMRVYFEKPRTTVGWKGLINDPDLDGSFSINKGLRRARGLLVDLADMGVPAGTEFLDTITPQFLADLVSWGAIGARTTESQVHRELASGLSMPVGFKNGTEGSVMIAIDAIRAARHSHHFLSVTKQGISAIVGTRGNDECHLILRGSNRGPNYQPEEVESAALLLTNNACRPFLMIDCSHGNSGKDHRRQPIVVAAIAQQLRAGARAIAGVMIESNLLEGSQSHEEGRALEYGRSITDGCLGWEETEGVLAELATAVRAR